MQPDLPLQDRRSERLRPAAKDVLDKIRQGWTSNQTIIQTCHTTEARAYISELRRAGYVVEDRWMKDASSGKRYKQWRVTT
jgi:hypothetical protein